MPRKEKKSTKNTEAQMRRRKTVKDSMIARAQYEVLVLRWQEKLLEPVTELMLKQAASYLTPDDYDSVIVERNSSDMCGYPLCDSARRELVQRYHISVRQRKVFDVEELANYCCNRCMVGSRFYRHQLSEEPLYMRDRTKPFDIDIMSLTIKDTKVDEEKKEDGEEEEAIMNWHKKSLMASMNIPDKVKIANPLVIVEHDSSDHDAVAIEQTLDGLSHTDIEGFASESEAIRIKENIGNVKNMVEEAIANSKDGEVLKITTNNSKDVDPSRILQPSLSLWTGSSDSEDEEVDDSDLKDSGHFGKLYASEGSERPTLSLFGRMWTLVDRITTTQTQQFLSDLRKAYGEIKNLHQSDYYIYSGDTSMTMRHNLLMNAMEKEIGDLSNRLGLSFSIKRQVRMLVTTLELNGSMVVFSKPEVQLLGLLIVLALSPSIEKLNKHLQTTKAQQTLDQILDDLGTDQSSLKMISRRFQESY